ncbi:MAG: hypothetical protein H0U67_06975 [Gemmatimonadetes bacterium]|nr:hypothetical protein [Gemmatimonadota bacterium]MBA4159878.1 hypothetical protein [Gemmatimonadota bacterium]
MTKTVRYYQYISDDKVGVLLPQFDRGSRWRTNLRLSVGEIAAEIHSEPRELTSRVARLEAVERHLRRACRIGTLEEPASWFGGSCLGRIAYFTEDPRGVFVFAPVGHRLLVIGGSAKHLIGVKRKQRIEGGYSFFPRMIEALLHSTTISLALQPPDEESMANPTTTVAGGERAWGHLVEYALRDLRAPRQRYEFLAKRLHTVPYRGLEILVATPLFIAVE